MGIGQRRLMPSRPLFPAAVQSLSSLSPVFAAPRCALAAGFLCVLGFLCASALDFRFTDDCRTTNLGAAK